MKRTSVVLPALAVIGGYLLSVPAHAAPPTVTPSAGYDARLQEQRAAPPPAVQQPVEPVVTPAPSRRVKKTPAH